MELVNNPLFARLFARLGARNEERGNTPLFPGRRPRRGPRNEERGNRELRRELLAGLSGRVLEVGAGTGLNFPHYPASVGEVVAVEPEPYLCARAEAAAGTAPVPVRVTGGTAAELPAAGGEFDAVVISGLLCSVRDVAAALTEFARVLRPGGPVALLRARAQPGCSV